MEKITILITEDHTLVRETWCLILNNDPRFSVVAQCGTGEEAVELARKLHPDVVIMDINLPGISGIEATRLIHRYAPASRVLGVSLHTQPAYTRKMMQSGALGYVTKNSKKEEMLTAIIEVSRGHKYICEEIKNNLSDQLMYGEIKGEAVSSLTERELEVIDHLKKGCSSREIADVLELSVKTVEVHRYNILKKLDLRNTASLIEYMNKHLPLA